jgi:hypothetical protein
MSVKAFCDVTELSETTLVFFTKSYAKIPDKSREPIKKQLSKYADVFGEDSATGFLAEGAAETPGAAGVSPSSDVMPDGKSDGKILRSLSFFIYMVKQKAKLTSINNTKNETRYLARLLFFTGVISINKLLSVISR